MIELENNNRYQGVWSWIWKAGTILAVILAAIQINQSFTPTSGPLIVAHGQYGEFSIPILATLSMSLEKRIQITEATTKPLDKTNNEILRKMKKVQKHCDDARTHVKITIRNNGDRAAKNIVLHLPDKGYTTARFEDTPSRDISNFDKSIALGDLRQGSHATVKAWLPYIRAYAWKNTRVTFDEGFSRVDFAPTATGLARFVQDYPVSVTILSVIVICAFYQLWSLWREKRHLSASVDRLKDKVFALRYPEDQNDKTDPDDSAPVEGVAETPPDDAGETSAGSTASGTA